jgi:hypothetical protein
VLKGAIIFATGAAAGLVVGTFSGLFLGFQVSESIKRVSIGNPPEENIDHTVVVGEADAS